MYKGFEKSFLVFRIGDDLFASNSDQVRNILDTSLIKKESNSQLLYSNINGSKISVYDISEKMGIEKCESNNPCLIVMEHKNQLVGFIVDEVKSLVDIQNKNFIEIPRIGIKYNKEFVKKMAKVNNEFIGILNFERLVSLEADLTKNHYTKQKQVIFQ